MAGSYVGTSGEALESRVSELVRALQQAEAVCELTAGIVHDVNNALQVAQSEAELLAITLRQPEEIESINAVLLAAKHAHGILRGLLDFARKGEAKASLINGADVLASCRPLIEGIAQRRFDCEFSIDPDVWPVWVQRQQLDAALINLAANARDAMSDGGRLRIAVHNVARDAAVPASVQPGDYVAFSVEDTGVGMTPEVMARATEAFFTTKEVGRGTGLGLSMVQAFALRAGGTLRISSEPVRGTKVEILLPRAVPPEARGERDLTSDVLSRMRERIRTGWLLEVLDAWADASGASLPRPVQVQAALLAHVDSTIVLAVEGSPTRPTFRLVHLGDELLEALASAGLEGLPDGHPMLSAAGAYHRVLQTRAPSLESARYSFGDDSFASFERLILPASSSGEVVSHLIGAVVVVDERGEP